MKQGLGRRILTFFLSLMICFTSLQFPVFAAEDTDISSTASEESDLSRQLSEAGQKYLVTLEDTATGDIISNVVLPIGQNRDELEKSFIENINPNFRLVDISEYNEEIDESTAEYSSDEDGIQPYVVETLFDIGCLVISASEFYNNPSVWNGMFVIFDGASVLLPFVPSVSGIVRLIKGSDKVHDSMTYGIKTYRELKKESSILHPAHHIMPKKFSANFGLNENDMFAIIIDQADHIKITGRFNSSKYGLRDKAETYSRSFIKQQSERIYRDLYEETGDDIYLFMAKFIAELGEYGI